MLLSLGYMWFVFKIPVAMSEIMLVAGVPSVFVLLRLDELMEENVYRRTMLRILDKQKKASFAQTRRRTSLFKKTPMEVAIETQDVSKRVKYGVSILTFLSGIAFSVIGILAASVSPTCDDALYKHCRVPRSTLPVKRLLQLRRVKKSTVTT